MADEPTEKEKSMVNERLQTIGFRLVRADGDVVEVSSLDDTVGRTFKDHKEFADWVIMEEARIHTPDVPEAQAVSGTGSLVSRAGAVNNGTESEQPSDQPIIDVYQIARTAHEVNRAYCEGIGDSMVPWDNAPEWQRESALAGVRNVLENPNITPEQSHESWLKHKRADGWKYGPVKDADKKEHPCFCDYNVLPPGQRMKDRLFIAVVRSFM